MGFDDASFAKQILDCFGQDQNETYQNQNGSFLKYIDKNNAPNNEPKYVKGFNPKISEFTLKYCNRIVTKLLDFKPIFKLISNFDLI